MKKMIYIDYPQMTDIRDVEKKEICIIEGKLWINTEQGCIFRAQGVSEIILDDQWKGVRDEQAPTSS